ncbi:MAG: hypothetical protein ACKOB5_06590, partial [Betaproteobacteria bacterium]
LALGEKLMAEHRCSACHARKVGGDGSAIYRPMGKINTAREQTVMNAGSVHDTPVMHRTFVSVHILQQ